MKPSAPQRLGLERRIAPLLAVLILLVIASTLTACNRTVPLENPTMAILAPNSDKVKMAIKRALVGRDWNILSEKPGSITAQYDRSQGSSAQIRVDYTKDEVRIHHVKSVQLLHEKDANGREVIHRNYRNWIARLQKDIRANLVD